MLPDLPTAGPLPEAVANGRATLVLGPAFGHAVPALDLWSLVESIGERLPEIPGWDGLHLPARLTLCRTALGAAEFDAQLAEHLPSAEALAGSVSETHAALLSLPFQVVATTELDDLAAATLSHLGIPFAAIRDDEWQAPAARERRLVMLRGDRLLGPHPGPADLQQIAEQRPAVVAALRRRAARGPVLLYGFAAQDPQLDWLLETVLGGERRGGAWLVARQASGLWVDVWRERGVELCGHPTLADMDRQTRRFAEAVRALAAPAEDDAPTFALLAEAARAQTVSALTERFPWATLDGLEFERAAEQVDASSALRGVRHLAASHLPVPAGVAARLADLLGRAGRHPEARDALALAFDLPGPLDPTGEACVGRALVRREELERGRRHLERALAAGDPQDPWGRADELAWLVRCVLDRLERLEAAGRHRAALETLAAFLSGQASRLSLAALEPGEDEALGWTAYYINLRLGQILIAARAMAEQSAEIYAEQAIAMLERAVALHPEKPDPYRAARPLLAKDPERWQRMLAAAPPSVRRKVD